jgi:hypothetical protein
LRPAWENSSQDTAYKIIRAKWRLDVAQVVEHLLCKSEAPSSNPSPIKPNETKQTTTKNLHKKSILRRKSFLELP